MADNLTIWDRLQTESPKFFNKIKAVALTLATIAGVILAAPLAVKGFIVSPLLDTICQYMIVAGLVATAVSQTTVKN